jgi:hypothetical protein
MEIVIRTPSAPKIRYSQVGGNVATTMALQLILAMTALPLEE